MQELPKGVILEDMPCPNGCAREDEFILGGEDFLCGISGTFSVYRCKNCALERTNPRPTSQSIGAYYPASYSPYLVDSELPNPEGGGCKKKLARWFGLYARQLPDVPPGKMLEIGCSTGRYMAFARARGWQVEGIEYSTEAAKSARSKGFTVTNLPIEDVALEESKYDIVVAWMVLEHLHDPVGALKKIGRAIAPGGRLVLSVPENRSLARMLFGKYCYDLQLPTHLYHYSKDSLCITLETAGWEIERVIWQRNCQSFLKSALYFAEDRNYSTLKKAVAWIGTNPRANKLRTALNILIGITRMSGRIEVWAKLKGIS